MLDSVFWVGFEIDEGNENAAQPLNILQIQINDERIRSSPVIVSEQVITIHKHFESVHSVSRFVKSGVASMLQIISINRFSYSI